MHIEIHIHVVHLIQVHVERQEMSFFQYYSDNAFPNERMPLSISGILLLFAINLKKMSTCELWIHYVILLICYCCTEKIKLYIMKFPTRQIGKTPITSK